MRYLNFHSYFAFLGVDWSFATAVDHIGLTANFPVMYVQQLENFISQIMNRSILSEKEM